MKKHNLLFLTLIMSLLFVSWRRSSENPQIRKKQQRILGKIAYRLQNINQDKKYFKLVDGGESN